MNKKHILILLFVGLLTYINVLFNDFVGDDNLLFINNTFYSSWKNLPRLFQTDSIVTSRNNLFNSTDPDKGSINPSFRVMDKILFFVEYGLWGKNPMGYHAVSVSIHLVNVLVLYLLLSQLFSSWISLLAALLFCVHPIVCETVDTISYRGDLLAVFFVLMAFYCWVKFSKSFKNKIYYFCSILFCFLAFLTKESTATLPLMILWYQWLFSKETIRKRYVSGYWFILCIYLFIYFFKFPHSILLNESTSLFEQLLLMIQSLLEYIKSFFLPFSVHPLPPGHVQILKNIDYMRVLGYGIGTVMLLGLMLDKSARDKRVVLFLGWFAIFYIPISGLFPLNNVMTYRFIYLPVIGLCVFSAFVMEVILKRFLPSKSSCIIIWSALLLVFAIYTIELNFIFKKDISITSSWIDNYPKNQYGYLYLGDEYYKLNRLDKAQEVLEQGLKRNVISLEAKKRLVFFYVMDQKLDQAERVLKTIIEKHPFDEESYRNLAAVYKMEGKIKEFLQIKDTIERSFLK